MTKSIIELGRARIVVSVVEDIKQNGLFSLLMDREVMQMFREYGDAKEVVREDDRRFVRAKALRAYDEQPSGFFAPKRTPLSKYEEYYAEKYGVEL